MQTYRVELGERAYPIHIGSGLLNEPELIVSHLPQKRVAIITNATVAPMYLNGLRAGLRSKGVQCHEIVLPDGEQYKNWETLNRIFDALLAEKCERGTTLIALGGGVIGDITGFAAATYLRGVPFMQIPTTLLAQVDSSIGGKTAINHPLGKNMIGAFYQPRLVIADMQSLATLSDRELKAGLAEIIKHGFIRDAALVSWIEENIQRLLARDTEALEHVVMRSCEIKGAIVAADERELGERALLNFGHTFGHAIESGLGYGNWLHGEAVAAGMVLAADLSWRMGMISKEIAGRVRDLVCRAGLPVEVKGLTATRMLELMSMDKKAKDGALRFILLNGMGSATLRGDVPRDLVLKSLSNMG